MHYSPTKRLRDTALRSRKQREAEPFFVYPDCAFVIRRNSDGKTFPFVVELDNGTERVRSKQDTESIERKLRAYDTHQSRFDAHDPERYLVLFITTRSELRLLHILDAAASIMTQPQRRVFVGVELNQFLNADSFRFPVFQDHRNLKRTLIPRSTEAQKYEAHRGLYRTMEQAASCATERTASQFNSTFRPLLA